MGERVDWNKAVVFISLNVVEQIDSYPCGLQRFGRHLMSLLCKRLLQIRITWDMAFETKKTNLEGWTNFRGIASFKAGETHLEGWNYIFQDSILDSK